MIHASITAHTRAWLKCFGTQYCDRMSVWQALCSFPARLGLGEPWVGPAGLSTGSGQGGDRWGLDTCVRVMGTLGGDSTHQNCPGTQELMGTCSWQRNERSRVDISALLGGKSSLSFWEISLWQKLVKPGSSNLAALAHGELLLLLLWHDFAVKITPQEYKGKGRNCLKTYVHLGTSVSPPNSLW